MSRESNRYMGKQTFAANGPHHDYHLVLMYSNHCEDQKFDTAMVCIYACSTRASVVPIKSKTASDLAHGMIEPFVHMGKPPRIIDTGDETGIRHSGNF